VAASSDELRHQIREFCPEAVIVYAFGCLERRGQEMHRVRLEVDAAMAEAKKAKARAEREEMLVTVLTD
jgi:hypothetical protein